MGVKNPPRETGLTTTSFGVWDFVLFFFPSFPFTRALKRLFGLGG